MVGIIDSSAAITATDKLFLPTFVTGEIGAFDSLLFIPFLLVTAEGIVLYLLTFLPFFPSLATAGSGAFNFSVKLFFYQYQVKILLGTKL